MNYHHKMTHALTQYDARASKRKGYNIFALPQYLSRVDAVVQDIEAGADPAKAIAAGFSGRLQDLCLKACGFEKLAEPISG
jgi:hypothetical protein